MKKIIIFIILLSFSILMFSDVGKESESLEKFSLSVKTLEKRDKRLGRAVLEFFGLKKTRKTNLPGFLGSDSISHQRISDLNIGVSSLNCTGTTTQSDTGIPPTVAGFQSPDVAFTASIASSFMS